MINYDYGRLTGEIITREDFEYEEERKAWNRAIEKYPLIIVYCKTEDDIKNAISIYNSANSKPHHDGTGWFDFRLHLRHLAFVYGTEYVTDKDFNLIEKKPDDNNALDGQTC